MGTMASLNASTTHSIAGSRPTTPHSTVSTAPVMWRHEETLWKFSFGWRHGSQVFIILYNNCVSTLHFQTVVDVAYSNTFEREERFHQSAFDALIEVYQQHVKNFIFHSTFKDCFLVFLLKMLFITEDSETIS